MGGAVAKSFLVLEAVSTSNGPVRLSALAGDLGLQKSTVHRVLAELVELGYVDQDPTSGLYQPTLRTWEIGTTVVADLPIKQVASGMLHDLHRETGETVSLVVRSGDDALYLDKLISPRPVGFSTRIGSRVPLPATVGGLAILAASDDAPEAIQRLAARTDLSTPIDVDATLRSLDTIRRRGHAASSGRQRIVGFAAAIIDRNQLPAGALIVSAPSDRMTGEQRTSTIDQVVAAAARLGESLGRT
jgi:DNA-binding IclR family transcriptional regulator